MKTTLLSKTLALLIITACQVSLANSYNNRFNPRFTDKQFDLIKYQVLNRGYHFDLLPGGNYGGKNYIHNLKIELRNRGETLLNPAHTDNFFISLKLKSIGYKNPEQFDRPQSIQSYESTVTYHWNDNIKEVWNNSSDSLEQSFIIEQRPEIGSEEKDSLVISMLIKSDLRKNLIEDEINFSDKIKYSKLKVWDSKGTVLPSKMALKNDVISLIVDEQNAIYPLTIDPAFQQQAYIKPHNTGVDDGFGFSIDISGDTLVVGGFREDGSPTGNGADDDDLNAGAVYVFIRNGNTWTQQAYLKASNSEAGDEFGRAVSISGDTLVVTAYGEDSSANTVNGNQNDNSSLNSGAAYVFVRSGTTWTQQSYIKPFNTDDEDRFGSSVAISGDYIVVGALNEDSNANTINGNQFDNSATNSGAAYIFKRAGATWSQEAYLKASNSGMNDTFGISVGISGEIIIIGARGEDGGSTGVNNSDDDSMTDAGAAYIFAKDSQNEWFEDAYLKASNTDSGDYFGHSVAISENTALVGATREDSSAIGAGGNEANNSTADSGAAYVFQYAQGAWTQQAYLKATNTDIADNFGWDVDIHRNTIIVGAKNEDSEPGTNEQDNSFSQSGAAYAFTRSSGGTWVISNGYTKPDIGGAGDEFGVSVAVSGGSFVIGAYKEDSNTITVNGDPINNLSSNSGAAYVFNDNDLIYANSFSSLE